MKKIINIVFSLLFFCVLVIPAVTAEYGKNVQSELDNAYLPELENVTVENFNTEFSNYFDKRIGFRDEMLTAYQKLNDTLFDVMEHPTYMYGEDGFVFFKDTIYINTYQHLDLDAKGTKAFADALLNFQNYVEGKGMDFLYFYLPDKETVYPEYYPKGVNVYGDVSRSDQIIDNLKKNGVNYLFTKDLMREHKKIELVNNKKYDAGHWNQNGAFVSIQHLYDVLRQKWPQIEPLKKDEFNLSTIIMESLPVSHFEINEEFVYYNLKQTTAVDKTAEFFRDVVISFPNHNKVHYENKQCADKPKLLIFGDSYLGGYERFFINHFSEYTYIHRYNVYNQEFFEYYVDKVNPDIVIFENPERSHMIDLYVDKHLP